MLINSLKLSHPLQFTYTYSPDFLNLSYLDLRDKNILETITTWVSEAWERRQYHMCCGWDTICPCLHAKENVHIFVICSALGFGHQQIILQDGSKRNSIWSSVLNCFMLYVERTVFLVHLCLKPEKCPTYTAAPTECFTTKPRHGHAVFTLRVAHQPPSIPPTWNLYITQDHC